MNDRPIHEQESLIDRLKTRRVDSYRFAALKVIVIGLVLTLVGELVELSGLSAIGIWVMLAAFPIHLMHRVAHYARVMKEADQEIDEAVRNAAEVRKARGD